MKTSEFNFSLPTELIAQRPAKPRDTAKLLKVSSSGNIQDFTVRDLPKLLNRGDTLVINNTKVIPAQLWGTILSRNTKVRANLHKHDINGNWDAFTKPAKKIQINDRISFGPSFYAMVTNKKSDGQVTLNFNIKGADFFSALNKFGAMPLPPYIKRSGKGQSSDHVDYQTAFASIDGAVASPTASLHFTPALIKNLNSCGIKIVPITLHVGAGTFFPIRSEKIEHHKMHSEWIEVSSSAAAQINETRDKGGRVIAVGTTVLRALEAVSDANQTLHPYAGYTDIFISPGYKFKIVDLLLTNFHLPKSTLFILVSAFCGLDRMKNVYKYAIQNKYRFFSYGDTTLLEINENLQTHETKYL